MSTSNRTPVLFDENEILDEGDDRRRTAINRALSFVDQAGVRVVLNWREPLFRFALSDTLTLRYVAVHLRIGNLATQEEIAEAFDHSVATQRRWENRYQARVGGLEKWEILGTPFGNSRNAGWSLAEVVCRRGLQSRDGAVSESR